MSGGAGRRDMADSTQIGYAVDMNDLNRRAFLAAGAAAAVPLIVPLPTSGASRAQRGGQGRGGPVVISSGNGLRAVVKAMDDIKGGADPVDAVVAGVAIVENDPNDMSVGYGGLPNENGVVQLDASVMHGPSHKAGSVGALENIPNAAAVALKVLRRTDHVMLVGAGALAFAKAHGFKEQDMLTDQAREAWLRWKENLNKDDDWLNEEQHVDRDARAERAEQLGIPYHYGTIHCAALNEAGDVSACTTTSGLSYKIPGRVGDSPIIGAGMFVDNEVGAAGATGRGEAVMQSCGAFQTVQHMANGLEPEEACLKTLKWIADHTKRRSLLTAAGRPNYNVTMYALRKDGKWGSACMLKGGSFAVHDGTQAQHLPSTPLFE